MYIGPKKCFISHFWAGLYETWTIFSIGSVWAQLMDRLQLTLMIGLIIYKINLINALFHKYFISYSICKIIAVIYTLKSPKLLSVDKDLYIYVKI